MCFYLCTMHKVQSAIVWRHRSSQLRFKVSLILGPDPDGVGGIMSLSMTMADIGGLVAKGEGTAAGNPNDVLEGPRLNPRFGGKLAEAGGGLVAEPDGVRVVGAVPLLNSAQRGHFRFVSASFRVK
jgi:hypothetical protein